MGFWRIHSQSSFLYTETMKGKERVLPYIGQEKVTAMVEASSQLARMLS